MTIRSLTMGVAALTFAGIGGAAAQAVYVEQITPAPVYMPSDIDGYVIEQRYVPVAPQVTYENQVITPSRAIAPRTEQVVIERRIETPVAKPAVRASKATRVVTERRVVTQPLPITPQVVKTAPNLVLSDEPRTVVTREPDGTTITTTETNALSSCRYDEFNRMICD
jgi:hypothetical protein